MTLLATLEDATLRQLERLGLNRWARLTPEDILAYAGPPTTSITIDGDGPDLLVIIAADTGQVITVIEKDTL